MTRSAANNGWVDVDAQMVYMDNGDRTPMDTFPKFELMEADRVPALEVLRQLAAADLYGQNPAASSGNFQMHMPGDEVKAANPSKMREFGTGATRHVDDKKIDYEGHLSPIALKAYGEYMHGHCDCGNGEMRASDNWQKGIPQGVYVKSLLRHTVDVWSLHRGVPVQDTKDNHDVDIVESLCGVLFNAFGLLHEHLKEQGAKINEVTPST